MHFLVKRGERKRIPRAFSCVSPRRSSARTMNNKDVEKDHYNHQKHTTNREKVNLPLRHDGVLRWRASFVLHIEDWKIEMR